jgi:hypothetical protein
MARESQSIDSIYDFLYADTERLRSWLAQVVDDGVPIGHKHTSQTGETATSEVGGGVDASAKANALIAKADIKGGVSGKIGSQQSANLSYERSFDSSWSLPLNVLDRLDELDFIERDLSAAKIGSLVLVTGTPQLLDIKLLQDVWTPGTSYMAADAKVTHQNKTQLTSAKAMMKGIGEILKVMPPAPQLTMVDHAGNNVWACLQDQHLIVSAASLALTHGSTIRGVWHVLAVLDATPDAEDDDDTGEVVNSQLMSAASTLLGAIRELMGRSPAAYGVTPVLIFRAVSSRD